MAAGPYIVSMEIAGDTALWNRPDVGDSPLSGPIPSVSAVIGIFSSVLWGPGILIRPRRVEICAPLVYHSYATNYGGPLRNPKDIRANNQYQMFATVLIDVCYRIYSEVVPNPDKASMPLSALAWDKNTSSPGHTYKAIFERRLKRGQFYHTPWLGLKEFTASYAGPFREGTRVEEEMTDIRLPSLLRRVFPEGYAAEPLFKYDTDVLIHRGAYDYPEGWAHD